jgi:LytR cell envelope-related transcriptional attenuator
MGEKEWRRAGRIESRVDHPLHPSVDVLVRPWRLAAFVAGSIALVELLVLLAIGGGALVGAVSSRLDAAAKEHALATPQAGEPKPTTPAKRESAELPRSKTVVLVRNGNGRTGAAAAAATRVRRDGYKIGAVGNAPHTGFPHDLVMFRPGFSGEARRLAHDMGVGPRRVSPLDGIRLRDLGRAHAVLVLGA